MFFFFSVADLERGVLYHVLNVNTEPFIVPKGFWLLAASLDTQKQGWEERSDSVRQELPIFSGDAFVTSLVLEYCFKPVVRNLSVHLNHLEGLLKHRLLTSVPRVSDSLGLRVGLKNLHF